MSHSDTIVAIATPPGAGGIGIVRLSGPAALRIGRAVFHPRAKSFDGFEPRRLHLGDALDRDGGVVDEVLAVAMPGPGSFTGEDVLELHCHGSPAVLRAVLTATVAAGARPADRGEFSRRALLNGRLDLTQAEAVAELCAARSVAEARMARERLSGGLGRMVAELRRRLLELRTRLCAAVDFPDDELECLASDVFAAEVQAVRGEIAALLDAFGRSKLWRQGAVVVLAGRVNAGKSSLLNALLGRDRAIVSATAGTTRDWLEESLELDGLPVRLVDTAGLRGADEAVGDMVEAEGIRRSGEQMAAADLLLLVHDRSLPLDAGEEHLLTAESGRTLLVLNKADLPEAPGLAGRVVALGAEVVAVAAREGQNLDGLLAAVRRRLVDGGEPLAGEVVPNLRQAQALELAEAELAALCLDIRAGLPYDCLGVRLELTCNHLAEVIGHLAAQDVLDAVFQGFCIGK